MRRSSSRASGSASCRREIGAPTGRTESVQSPIRFCRGVREMDAVRIVLRRREMLTENSTPVRQVRWPFCRLTEPERNRLGTYQKKYNKYIKIHIIHKIMPATGKRAAKTPQIKHAGSATSVPRMRHRRMLFFPSPNSKADHPGLFFPKSADYYESAKPNRASRFKMRIFRY